MRRVGRGRALALVTVLGLVLVAAAYAEIIRYSTTSPVGPGATFQTDGHNTRDYNYACREGNSGQASARYYSSGTLISNTGVVWTNCAQGASAYLSNNGNYVAWCRHEGTVSWPIACVTTRP